MYGQQRRRRQRSIKNNGDFATEINSASVVVLLEAEVILGENPLCSLILITTISARQRFPRISTKTWNFHFQKLHS